MTYSTTIGDSQKVAVAPQLVALPQSTVTAANVAAIGSAINNAEVSGKKAGATIIYDNAGTLSLAIAQGADTNSPWIVVDGVNTTVTPA